MNYLLLPERCFTTPITVAQIGAPPASHLLYRQSLPRKHYHRAVIEQREQIDHVIEVLDAKVGDTLKIGQLQGNLGHGVISGISSTTITLSEISLDIAPPAKLGLTVVLALPRPKVLRRLIMDMTALGVAHIILLNSYRSQKSYWQSPMLDRLEEFVFEGLQQAGDSIAPRISLKKRFKPFVEDELAQYLGNAGGVVAHPYAARSFDEYFAERLASKELQPTAVSASTALPSVLCIGAEGGWIDYEVALLAEHGCVPISIGRRILRTEAAVNVLIGQWLLTSQ